MTKKMINMFKSREILLSRCNHLVQQLDIARGRFNSLNRQIKEEKNGLKNAR